MHERGHPSLVLIPRSVILVFPLESERFVGAVMPTEEGDQGDFYFFNHPERGGYPAA